MRRAVLPVLIVVGGLVVALISDGAAETVGWAIVALGAMLATGLVFLEIGYSEDRERARGRS